MKVSEFLEILCKVLDREPGSLALEDTPNSVEEWDSLGHLDIMSAVDKELEISIDEDDLQTFASLGELVATLKARGALED